MKQEQEKPVGLPENAFRPLKPGEKYHPFPPFQQLGVGERSSGAAGSAACGAPDNTQ